MKTLTMILGLALMAGTAGQAATVVANAEIDLTSAIDGSAWTGYGHALDSAVTVNNGDRVTINITFAPGQALTWAGDGTLDAWLMLNGAHSTLEYPDHAGGFTWSNTVVEFQGLTVGTQIGATSNGGSGSIHLGPTFSISGGNIYREFTGVSVSFDTLFNDADPLRIYDTVGYQFLPLFAGTVGIEDVAAAVPLPASLPVLLAGLGALGLVRRRRRG